MIPIDRETGMQSKGISNAGWNHPYDFLKEANFELSYHLSLRLLRPENLRKGSTFSFNSKTGCFKA